MIYTIKKSDIEKLIKGKIKKQQIVVGFDTASKTGLAVFTVYEKYENVQLEVALKEFKSKDICDRYDEMIDCFKEFLLTKTPSRVIIEDTYLRFGNAKTFSTLSRFGMIAYVLCRELGIKKSFLSPRSSRTNVGLIKPKLEKSEIIKYINNNLGTTIKDDNIADAVVLALNGIEYEKCVKIENIYIGLNKETPSNLGHKSKNTGSTKQKKKSPKSKPRSKKRNKQ